MNTDKFKVGDLVWILSYPGIWSSGADGSHPKNAKYPIEGIIENLNTKYGHTAIKVLGYGFNLGVLIEKGLIQLIEPIPPAPRWTVGQEVWDDVLFNGLRGNIIHIGESPFPVEVKFGDAVGQSRCYSLDGRLYTSYAPTLSAVPYTFELPPQPEPIWIPEKWERVLVRDEDYHKWCAHIFFKYHAGRGFPFQIMNEDGGCWKYCIPFDPDKVGKV